ncbi:aspartate/glutamate racemase family protein [Halpernia sp.]|uniref:aspartate/glutamate racemase family protein n=1 Tax=Halpernia sp. TaxID=2782209 RepID=UPI003A8D1348
MKIENHTKGVLGLGKESTLYYLDRIHQKFSEIKGGFSTCPMLLYQIDFQEINTFLPNQFSFLKPKVEFYLNKISELGISKLIIPNITLHETLELIKIPFEICHPVDLTIKYLKKKNISEIVIFGTIYTMNSDYLKEKFNSENIKIIQPSLKDQENIDNFRKSVYDKKTSKSQVDNFQFLIKKYSDKYSVVIACTELSIFAPKENKNILDMAELQMEEFLK